MTKYEEMLELKKQCIDLNVPVPLEVTNYLKEEDPSPMQTKFRRSFIEYGTRIQEQIDIAEQAYDDALKLANKSGIPFVSTLAPIYAAAGAYEPDNFHDMFPDLDKDFLEEMTGIYNLSRQTEGWDSSSADC